MSPNFNNNALPLSTPGDSRSRFSITHYHVDKVRHHKLIFEHEQQQPFGTPSVAILPLTVADIPYRQRTPGDVPTAVKELLASTKDLQAVLRQWSQRGATETDVSNIFVKVGTEFHTTIDAFAYHGINLK